MIRPEQPTNRKQSGPETNIFSSVSLTNSIQKKKLSTSKWKKKIRPHEPNINFILIKLYKLEGSVSRQGRKSEHLSLFFMLSWSWLMFNAVLQRSSSFFLTYYFQDVSDASRYQLTLPEVSRWRGNVNAGRDGKNTVSVVLFMIPLYGATTFAPRGRHSSRWGKSDG